VLHWCRQKADVIYLTSLVLIVGLICILWAGHVARNAKLQSEAATAVAATAQQKALDVTNKSLHASCDFYHDLAGLSPAVLAPTGKPSELGVSIIVHSRIAFTGQQCKGTIPPSTPLLKKWSAYYHLPAS
jgi:hypothetical protein